ncbi:MAG: DUF1573 domain-containing protein [Spirochaetales bacterium]|nr:DUF1573 domain-containing protein [Spirochaetales bacterium]
MKKSMLIPLSLCLLFFTLVLSCDDETAIPPNLSTILGITIDEAAFDAAEIFDFGLIEAENDSKTVNLNLINTGDADITVTAVELSDSTNYSLTKPELPLTTVAGGSAEASVTFSPIASGAFSATVSITVEGFTDPFVVNITGEGNYPPTVQFGIEVTGAGTAAANGFYTRNGFKSPNADSRPRYDKAGSTNYYCYIYFSASGDIWCIADTLNAANSLEIYPEYEYPDSFIPLVPPASGWTTNEGLDEPPTITRYDITGVYNYDNEELTANYFFSDADGDAENTAAASFQWYKSAIVDGTYTAIGGATAKTFTPNESAIFLKVAVTPVAATGITAGTATLSSATAVIIPSGPPPDV